MVILNDRCLKVKFNESVRDASNADRQLKYPAKVGYSEPGEPADNLIGFASGNQVTPPKSPRSKRLMAAPTDDFRKPHDDDRGEESTKTPIEKKIDLEVD